MYFHILSILSMNLAFSSALQFTVSTNTVPKGALDPSHGVKTALTSGQVAEVNTKFSNRAHTQRHSARINSRTPMSQYTIVAGDTLWSIAQTLGTTVEVLEAINPGIVSINLQIGQIIQIPSIELPLPQESYIPPPLPASSLLLEPDVDGDEELAPDIITAEDEDFDGEEITDVITPEEDGLATEKINTLNPKDTRFGQKFKVPLPADSSSSPPSSNSL